MVTSSHSSSELPSTETPAPRTPAPTPTEDADDARDIHDDGLLANTGVRIRMGPTTPNRTPTPSRTRTPFQDISNNQTSGIDHNPVRTRPPFQDISNNQTSDPKELKRQRDRERYAKNKDEINKRRREAYKRKKNTSEEIDGLHNGTPAQLAVSQATGQEAVTQLQNITGPDGALPTLGPYNGFIQTDKENISDNDESDWLHRNDAYQMQRSSRRMTLTQLAGVDNPQLNTVVNLRTPGVTFHDQGNDHGEYAYGILEPDVQTVILDGMQNGSLRFLYPDNMCHKRNLRDLVHHNSVLFMIY
ncbi:uncharacterized protein [Triticum aestivum]|uniref:uncharacterized protein isoform X1 n=2 Tax=Triticum aestivum TaxID=4565 RepID=UPI001D02A974|nr:uncharacterized protein LOC123162468 isoform X1 [Triticum aestivum]XP_044436182.1 uncharacterized protein LOC123162468 isoform X1 [Triticum aestivum]XP_044436183.1 uncharacterized protein LOC123162468 isoform X1 [Triticum aestivum]XP_044436185.1 uncharacterized protein LOC123162468 isoform X1 [Triticum aestivum]